MLALMVDVLVRALGARRGRVSRRIPRAPPGLDHRVVQGSEPGYYDDAGSVPPVNGMGLGPPN